MAYTTPKTWASGDILTAADLNTYVRDNTAALYGTTTSYTPQVDQGASTNISKTVNEARYVQAGRVCFCWGYLTLTGAGTGGSHVTVTLPIAASGHASVAVIGVAMVYDNSTTTRYVCDVELNGGKMTFANDASASGNLWGASPSIALASSDQLRWQVTYIVA